MPKNAAKIKYIDPRHPDDEDDSEKHQTQKVHPDKPKKLTRNFRVDNSEMARVSSLVINSAHNWEPYKAKKAEQKRRKKIRAQGRFVDQRTNHKFASKSPPTSNAMRTTITVNNEAQIQAEHNLIVNQLIGEPKAMIHERQSEVLNSWSDAARKAAQAARQAGRGFKAGRTMAKSGQKVPGALKTGAFKAGQFSTTRGAKIGAGAAGAGAVGAGAVAAKRRKKK
jgi:hypothetical protein